MKYREPVDPQALLASLTLEKLNQIYKSILKKTGIENRSHPK